MPDSNLRDALVNIVSTLHARPSRGLKGLGIVCKVSALSHGTRLVLIDLEELAIN